MASKSFKAFMQEGRPDIEALVREAEVSRERDENALWDMRCNDSGEEGYNADSVH